jgi:hypothetical protein
MTERVKRYASNFRILTSEIIFCDERLNFIAHGFINRHLASDCGATRGFRTPAGFENGAAITR